MKLAKAQTLRMLDNKERRTNVRAICVVGHTLPNLENAINASRACIPRTTTL